MCLRFDKYFREMEVIIFLKCKASIKNIKFPSLFEDFMVKWNKVYRLQLKGGENKKGHPKKAYIYTDQGIIRVASVPTRTVRWVTIGDGGDGALMIKETGLGIWGMGKSGAFSKV